MVGYTSSVTAVACLVLLALDLLVFLRPRLRAAIFARCMSAKSQADPKRGTSPADREATLAARTALLVA